MFASPLSAFSFLSYIVSEILPHPRALTAYMTTIDLENYFRSKAAVEVVAHAIVAVSFVGDIGLRCIFRVTGRGKCPIAEVTIQGHSRSLQIVLLDR